MTETFGQVATLRPGSSLGYLANPLPGVEVRIESDGRIALRSDQISPGYLGEADRDDSWFVTNDLGQVDDEGAIEVLGRVDVIIVTGGENVDPLRVEAELIEHDGVEEAVVVGLPHPEWGSLLICLYTGSAGPTDLEESLRNRLEGFMVPKLWINVDALPRSDIGKIDRVAALGLATDA
jgi:acyl-CoA synthetase (AMP-forming)/AMP-acid ligase II